MIISQPRSEKRIHGVEAIQIKLNKHAQATEVCFRMVEPIKQPSIRKNTQCLKMTLLIKQV